MSTNWLSDVQEFLDKFHQDSRQTPGWPPVEIINLRKRLITEEYLEMTNAWMCRDLPDTVDGILDLVYVLLGTLPALGVDAQPIWDAIHDANMAKAGGGKDERGKVRKPPGWVAPDVRGLLAKQSK